MEPTQELVDALYRDKLRAARRESPDQKMASVLELSEEVFRRMADGVRHRFPNYTEDKVWAEVRRCLDIARRNENHPLPSDLLLAHGISR